jgi:medium-chain acyl-[acyl-carrier-protein] hydrolase
VLNVLTLYSHYLLNSSVFLCPNIMEQQQIWQNNYQVTTFMANHNGLADFTTILNFLQETATQNANHLKFGYHDLQKLNLVWVLSRINLKIDSFPKWDETVIVQTWPRAPGGMFAYREFLIKDTNSNTIGAATSSWVLIDKNTHRPQKISVLGSMFNFCSDDKVFGGDAEKIIMPGSPEYMAEHTVAYSDLDMSGHANNTKYVQWSLDALPDEKLNRQYKCISINFLSESFKGDTIQILGIENNNELFITGIKKADNKSVYTAKLSF